jgi:DNA-binding transcriptional LysR family regulator
VSDYIDFRQKQAAVALADTQDLDAAAARLGTTASDIKRQIGELQEKLCLNLFEPELDPPTLTDDGRFLIRAFRETLARHKQI